MEPKSIAFYTAVAIGMLAVLGATIIPTLVQAVQAATPLTADNNKGNYNQGAAGSGGSSNSQKDKGDSMSSSSNPGAAAADDKQPQKDKGDSMSSSSNSQKDKGDSMSSNSPQKDNSGQINDNTRNRDNNDNGAASRGLNLDPNDGVVSCGSIITKDTTLTRDLDCPDNGLIIAAPGVTLDLNGYTISSSGAGRNSQDGTTNLGGNSGILVTNADHVNIIGLGEVQKFDKGVSIIGSNGVTIEDLAIRDNDVGVYMSGSEQSQLSRDSLDNNGVAIDSEASSQGVIAFNQIIQNDEDGLLFHDSNKNVVAGNNIYENGQNGVYFNEHSSGNMVDYNNILGHNKADLNNADGLSPDVNHNVFGEHNNCGHSLPPGLCSGQP